MALSFTAGTAHLVNWGFSVGDVATIAGAGRKVGTWLLAQMQDRNLLDFLKLDIDSVFVRRGLIDVTKLHRRWDCKITLLQNGKPINVSHPGGSNMPVIENMDRFTWFMTLVIATLDAAVEPRRVRKIVTELLSKMFEESPNGIEYLLREIPHHIQGWRSSACVRGLLTKADNVWTELGIREQHWPGWVPELDYNEVLRLLLWLSTSTEQQLLTSSSDVFSIALVFREIGLEQIQCTKTEHHDESNDVESLIKVILETSPASDTALRSSQQTREGMRIPLNHMEECMSLYPGSRDFSGHLRTLFEDGMEAASNGEIEFRATDVGSAGWDFQYEVADKTDETKKPRMDSLLIRVFKAYLPAQSTRMEKCVQELIGSWTAEELKKLEENVQTGEPISSDEGREELQALLLGYYYALLLPLIDCSSLIQQEAYGSWGFHSHRFLNLLFTIIRQSKQSTVRSSGSNWVHKFSREAIFYLTAFLFAGGESSSPVFEVGGKTIGLTSKLSLVSSILLGKASNVEDAPKYCLLDCDMSAFPSTASGRIRDSSGSSGGLFVNRLQKDGRSGNFESILAHLNLDEFEENKGDSDDGDMDFTCHIEPDWDNDSTSVVLAFRHNGRIVSRMPALSILEALVSWKDTLDTDIVISRERKASRSQLRKESVLKWKMADFSFLTSASRVGSTVIFAEPSDFHGNHIALPVPSNSDSIDITRITASDSHKQIPKPGLPKDFGQVVFAILCRMPKAALCVTAMYQEFRDRYNVSMTTALVRSPDDLRDELEDGASVIVVC